MSMDLDGIKKHPLVVAILLVIATTSIVTGVIESVRVKPLTEARDEARYRVNQKDAELEELKNELSDCRQEVRLTYPLAAPPAAENGGSNKLTRPGLEAEDRERREEGQTGTDSYQDHAETEVVPQTVENFNLSVHRCYRSGQVVSCDFSIKNLRENSGVTVHFGDIYKSVMYDDQNRQYTGDPGQFGDLSGKQVSKYLLTGIPVKGRISFSGVPKDAKSVALLRIFTDLRRRRGFVDFNNIPISSQSE